jgi:myosin-crossreactive antigen
VVIFLEIVIKHNIKQKLKNTLQSMSSKKAYFVGGGIGSLAAAFFLIRDAGYKG